MSFQLAWANPNHTVLYGHFDAPWSWNELQPAAESAFEMLHSVAEPAHLVIDLQGASEVTQTTLVPHFVRILRRLPRRGGTAVFVSSSPTIKMALTVACKFSHVTDNCLSVSTLNDAGQYLNATINKSNFLDRLSERLRYAGAASGILNELRMCGWLTDGSLRGADLQSAQLAGFDLSGADFARAALDTAQMTGCDLARASLHGASLRRTVLARACLTGADLSRANLQKADLRGANLAVANLLRADLSLADLRGTNLCAAKLGGASLHGALLDSFTILPDGTRWSPENNLVVFTDLTEATLWETDDDTRPRIGRKPGRRPQ